MSNKPVKKPDYELTSCGGDNPHFPGGKHKHPFFIPVEQPRQPTQEEIENQAESLTPEQE